jgi:glutamate decarboxylase
MPAIGIAPGYLAGLATLVPGASTSPRHATWDMTAPLPAFTAELSRLVVMLNQNPMKMESSRLLSFLEREVLAKLHRLIYRARRSLL